MVHLSGNTSVVSKLSSDWLDYIGFPGDVCVAFFNVPPGNKLPWRQTPSRKKKDIVFTTVTTYVYQDQLNVGVSKVCEIFWIFKIRPRVSHTGLLLWRHFHTPKRDAERNELWLGLCDLDKKKLSRFLDFVFDFDLNHDFDTNRHALQL